MAVGAIVPSQAAQLARPQPGKDRRHDKRAPPALRRGEHGANLILGRDINANPDPPFVALVEPVLTAAMPLLVAHHIPANPAGRHRAGQDRAEAADRLFAMTRERPSRISVLRKS